MFENKYEIKSVEKRNLDTIDLKKEKKDWFAICPIRFHEKHALQTYLRKNFVQGAQCGNA